MDELWLAQKAQEYLETLCTQISNRRVGSEGNRLATAFFAETIKSFEFEVRCPEFECMDWQDEGGVVCVDGKTYLLHPSPYSLAIDAKAPLIIASSAADLETLDISNKILLMRGDLAKEQFMPKNFPFFQLEEQQEIIQVLEREKPLAIITATSRNPETAGALYPFPVFEDGDFDIPSAYTTEEQGAQLSAYDGQEIALQIRAQRIPARACNVVARKGKNPKERIVLFAHVDAKGGTPGALDNGTGTVTLLLLAELLRDYDGRKCIEIVALNGEDYYSNPGEQLYLQENEGRFDEIMLGINIDGMGYRQGKTAFSLYDCPPEMMRAIKKAFADEEAFLAGEPWNQGDHALFLMNGRPALALTSERVDELLAEIVHTEKDVPALVDYQQVGRTALALHRLLATL